MNLAHLHLLLNHLPVLGVPFGLILLCAGLRGRSDDLKRAALLSFIAAALLSLPVYFTGEPAEESVEDMPGVTEAYIERHEDRALFSLISVALLGLVSLVAVVRTHQRLSTPPISLILALAIVSSLSLGLTASAGGEVRHTEIRQQVWSGGEHLAS